MYICLNSIEWLKSKAVNIEVTVFFRDFSKESENPIYSIFFFFYSIVGYLLVNEISPTLSSPREIIYYCGPGLAFIMLAGFFFCLFVNLFPLLAILFPLSASEKWLKEKKAKA